MSTQFPPGITRDQMAQAICKAWKALDADEPKCPFSFAKVLQMNWEPRSFEMPIQLISTQFVNDDDDEDDKVVKAGLRFKAKSDGFAILEMLLDVGVLSKANATFVKNAPPIATIEMEFPSADDLNLPQESYHLLFTLAFFVWINAHFIEAYNDCMREVMQYTMASHMAKSISSKIRSPKEPVH